MAGRGWLRSTMACGLLAATTLGTGCGAFFQCEGKASCGTSTSTSSDDVVYAANENSPGLYSYQIGTDGSMTGVTGSPFTLSSPATAMAVTPDNSLLYVAEASGTIYSYALSTVGIPSNGTQQSTAPVQTAAMAISPDGKWLVTLDFSSAATTISPYLRAYQIGTGGTLTAASTALALTSSQAITTYQLAFSSQGNLLALALGSAGTAVYSFSSSNGSFGSATQLDGSGSFGDNGVIFDSSNNLYVAQAGSTANGITVFPSGFSSGATGKNYSTGGGPRTPVFANKDSLLYTANISDGTITSLSVASAVLTPLGSAVSAPSGVQQLAVDQSGKFVVAAGTSGSAGLETFTIQSSGGLAAAKTAATGTSNGIPVLAVTH